VRTIGFLAYEQMQAIDLVGPLDVFKAANDRSPGLPPYRLLVIGTQAAQVRTESGLCIQADCELAAAPELHTLVIPGGAGSRVVSGDADLLHWLRRRCETSERVASVCTAVYLLAATGLLDGRRVTTHWRFAADVARCFPKLRLDADQLFIRDGKYYTSGGLTAGMDLALALVESDLGGQVALAVARELVMYVKRPGNQAQFSTPLAAQTRSGDERFGELIEWLLEHLAQDVDADRMADRVAMSPRNFRRVFKARFECTPARFLEKLRLERACLLLTAGHDGLDRIAVQVGFTGADAFRRSFRSCYGLSPSEFRERFGERPYLAGTV
jgi:transcriptional regulator GlxA family with amidase domain